MTMYQPGIPTGTVPLNEDYLNLQNNFQQLDTTYGIDHVKYSVVNNNGFHTVVHMVHNSGTPAPVSGSGEIYTRKINDGFLNDSSLFFQTATGIAIQLTRNFAPSAAQNGYTFLPGGFILQWGIVNGTHGAAPKTFNNGDTGTVTFATSNKAFPNHCYGIITSTEYFTSIPTSTSGSTVSYDQNTLSITKFDWAFNSNSGNITRFFWVAIGN